jgi:hypothetical protein
VLDDARGARGPLLIRKAKFVDSLLASDSKCLAASHKSRMQGKTTKARSSAFAAGRISVRTDD